MAGCGDVAVRRVIPALQEAGQEVTGVWGRTHRRVIEVSDRFRIPVASTDLSSVLCLADAVYVATPVFAHVPVALAAVDAGRHVLIEKPVEAALSTGADDLAALAADRGVTVGAAYYRRLNHRLTRLRNSAAVRAARHVEVEFRSPFDPPPEHPMYWRTVVSASGGGVLADAGSHRLDLLCWLFGPPTDIEGSTADPFPGGGERTAEVRLHWPVGRTARCRFSWEAGPAVDRMTISTANRTYVLDPLDAGLAANPHQPLVADFARAVKRSRDPACPLVEASIVDGIIATVLKH